MGELIVSFSGICVNVFDYVPSVPMRTVLPNAMPVLFGQVLMPGRTEDYQAATYFLMPHFPVVRTSVIGGETIPLMASYITVLNAKPQQLRREGEGFSLTDYACDVQPSPEVVLKGQAMAYFDCFGGTLQTKGDADEPRTAHIHIETHGTPRVSISSLPGVMNPPAPRILEGHELHISNLDVEPAAEDAEFDFLLNYLVTTGGIPRVLTRRVPGLSADPRPFSLERLGARMRALGLYLETRGTVAGWQKSIGADKHLSSARTATADPFHEAISSLIQAPVPFDPSCSFGNLP